MKNKEHIDLSQVLQDLVYVQATIDRLVFMFNDVLHENNYYDRDEFKEIMNDD